MRVSRELEHLGRDACRRNDSIEGVAEVIGHADHDDRDVVAKSVPEGAGVTYDGRGDRLRVAPNVPAEQVEEALLPVEATLLVARFGDPVGEEHEGVAGAEPYTVVDGAYPLEHPEGLPGASALLYEP